MNLKRCSRGHFYDVDKYATCPHCDGDELTKDTLEYSDQGAILPPTMPYSENDSGMYYGEYSDFSDTVEDKPNQAESSSLLASFVNQVNGADDSQKEEKEVFEDEEQDTVTQSYIPGNLNIEPVVGWLVVISGENAGKSYVLKAGRNFIGRAASMDVILNGDMSISRDRHAIVLYEPKRREFLVQPGESRELFYLNDEVVLTTIKLNAFDKLLIGKTQLVFVPLCGENFSWEEK